MQERRHTPTMTPAYTNMLVILACCVLLVDTHSIQRSAGEEVEAASGTSGLTSGELSVTRENDKLADSLQGSRDRTQLSYESNPADNTLQASRDSGELAERVNSIVSQGGELSERVNLPDTLQASPSKMNDHTKSSVVKRTATKHQREIRQVEEQLRKLQKMKCKPQQVKIPTGLLLESKDSLLDHSVFPQVIPVRRCLPSCSYCGDEEYGLENEVCTVIKKRKRSFSVFYIDSEGQRRYFRRRIEVHQKCKCLPINALGAAVEPIDP